jgi:hypothetical protein
LGGLSAECVSTNEISSIIGVPTRSLSLIVKVNYRWRPIIQATVQHNHFKCDAQLCQIVYVFVTWCFWNRSRLLFAICAVYERQQIDRPCMYLFLFGIFYFVSSTNLFQESKELIRPLNQRARSALNPHWAWKVCERCSLVQIIEVDHDSKCHWLRWCNDYTPWRDLLLHPPPTQRKSINGFTDAL